MWLQSKNNLGHFTGRPAEIYLVSSGTEHVVADNNAKKVVVGFSWQNTTVSYCWQLHTSISQQLQ